MFFQFILRLRHVAPWRCSLLVADSVTAVQFKWFYLEGSLGQGGPQPQLTFQGPCTVYNLGTLQHFSSYMSDF